MPIQNGDPRAEWTIAKHFNDKRTKDHRRGTTAGRLILCALLLVARTKNAETVCSLDTSISTGTASCAGMKMSKGFVWTLKCPQNLRAA